MANTNKPSAFHKSKVGTLANARIGSFGLYLPEDPWGAAKINSCFYSRTIKQCLGIEELKSNVPRAPLSRQGTGRKRRRAFLRIEPKVLKGRKLDKNHISSHCVRIGGSANGKAYLDHLDSFGRDDKRTLNNSWVP
ncbi:hypothetical protein F4814DRAFT_355522 [Daldinia grandis]|nr:hypothetical protein F4814DRAFT_355522 [Daldinia grandis]